MMKIDFDFYERCIDTLKKAFQKMNLGHENKDYDIYRSACIKEFEIILEQSGKLLRRILKSYEAQPQNLDTLTYKNVLRMAAKRGLIDDVGIDRWMNYRDVRNRTAHDYGVNFAEETIAQIPFFITDAVSLLENMKKSSD